MAFGAGLIGVAPAHAAAPTPAPAPVPVGLVCGAPSNSVITFFPALTLVQQSTVVHRTAKYSGCVSGTAPNVTSGLSDLTITMPDSCPMVMLSGPVNHVITWNTGQTSTLSATRTPSIQGSTLVVKFTGSISAGLFAGMSATQTYTGSAVDLISCLNGTGRVKVLTSSVLLKIA